MKLAVNYEIPVTDREIEAYRAWMELDESVSSEDTLLWITGTLKNSGLVGFRDIVTSGNRLLDDRDAHDGN